MALFKTRSPILGNPLSETELRKFTRAGNLQDWLRFSSTAAVHKFEDFLQDTINTDDWAVANGTNATTWAVVVHPAGTIRGDCGTTAATSGLQLASPAAYRGDYNCGFECRYQLSSIDEQRLEVGFVDSYPAVSTTIGNVLATPSFNTSTNVAMYIFNETSTTITTGLFTAGTGATADDARTVWTTNRPVAATWQTVRIQSFGTGNQLACWVDGVLLGNTGAVLWEGGTLSAFLVSVLRGDTAGGTVSVDYVRLWQDRPGAAV